MRGRVVRYGAWVAVCAALASGCSPGPPREDAVAVVRARPLESDVCFVSMMIPHHRQAVEMSEILLSKDGVWERGRRFARYVAVTQGQEVRGMQDWLTAWEAALADATEQLRPRGSGPRAKPSLTGPDEGASSGGHAGHAAPAAADEADLPSCGHEHGAAMEGMEGMPGMLSDEQLDALRQADAAQAQRLYLELMIPHHEGALTMAEEALTEAENPFVLSSATHVVQEQVSELGSLRAMIAALDSGDLGLPDDYVNGEYLTYGTAQSPAQAPSSEPRPGAGTP